MKRLPCLVLLVLSLAGCAQFGPRPGVCEELALLGPWLGRTTSAEGLRQWALGAYRIPEDYTKLQPGAERDSQLVGWSIPHAGGVDTWYSASVERDVVLWIEVQGVSGSLSDLSGCLGMPEQYYALYDYDLRAAANYLRLLLVYPSLGVFVDANEYLRDHPQQPPSIHSDLSVGGGFRLLPPAPAVVFVQELRVDGWDVPFKPWPGAWEKMEIEVGPGAQIP